MTLLTVNEAAEYLRYAPSYMRKLVMLNKENPRPYRRALMAMEQAEARVLQFRGIADADLSRDAYYESLGESMQDALNEPLLLNEMTDRHAAEYLRSTDDKRERFEAREKLATHTGVLAMEQEANAELARLADEHEKTVRYLEHEIERGKREIEETIRKLQDKLKEKSEKASTASGANLFCTRGTILPVHDRNAGRFGLPG